MVTMKNIKSISQMNDMKSLLLLISFLLFGFTALQAQDDEGDKRPVRDPFGSSLLIDNQTIIVPRAGTFQYDIQHRFGAVENGMSDLLGIYAPGSNIRMGVQYTVIENLSLGVGFTKLNKFVDFSLKYTFFKQTRDWSTPVTLTYYGNMAIDNREDDAFEGSQYPFINRLSSYNSFIVGSRITKNLSLQVTPSFTYFNRVDYGMNNYMVGVGVGARYKVGSTSSVIIEYTQQLTPHDEVVDVMPGLGIGWEFVTSAHAFHVFVSTFNGILPQYNMVWNENQFDTTGIRFGFNMTRLWNF